MVGDADRGWSSIKLANPRASSKLLSHETVSPTASPNVSRTKADNDKNNKRFIDTPTSHCLLNIAFRECKIKCVSYQVA